MTDAIMERLVRRGISHSPSRVGIGGRMYTVIDLEVMESANHERAGEIEFPPPGDRGWALSIIGGHRFAAWFEPAPLEAMTAAAADRILGGDDA